MLQKPTTLKSPQELEEQENLDGKKREKELEKMLSDLDASKITSKGGDLMIPGQYGDDEFDIKYMTKWFQERGWKADIKESNLESCPPPKIATLTPIR